tara:strand:- start:1604 stop:2101 length:498 start_codon:yes stop_codon:yes gene_type:complete
MAGNHSMDIVSNVNMQEVTNAVSQAMMEITQRFDFKKSISKIELNSKEDKLVLLSDDEFKMKSVIDILQNKLIKRSVSIKALVYGKLETAAGGTVRQEVTLQQGIPTDKAKDMVKQIKNMKLKVQAQIREKEVRVSGKKIDDLQNIIDLMKEKDFGLPLQFENFR